MDRPKSRLAPAMIAAWLLFGTLAGYVASYVLVSDRAAAGWRDNKPWELRHFNAKWQCGLLWPAAEAEANLRGIGLALFHQDEMEHDVFFSQHP